MISEMNNIKEVAIIGGGPVGIFSIFACGMQNLSCVLIDALDAVGGQCSCVYPEKNIYDIPGIPEIRADDLVQQLMKQAEPYKPELRLNSFVRTITREEDGVFCLHINDSEKIYAKAILLALGAGIFAPFKPDLIDLSKFEGKNVLYKITNLEQFKNKRVAIAGGGDSAVDWALTLSEIAEKVYLIHRREFIKAHPASWEKVKTSNKIELKIPYQLSSIKQQDNAFAGVYIKNATDEEELLNVDYLLPCFGLKSDISFLCDWNLEVEHNRIVIDPTTARTSLPGIYAIGDCVTYNNKRKLILTGFAEAAGFALDVFGYLYPDRAPVVGHSTTLCQK